MSDFAGLRSGGILDASRWHDRPITKTHLCKSELTFHYVLHALVSLVAFLLVGNAKPVNGEGLAGELPDSLTPA